MAEYNTITLNSRIISKKNSKRWIYRGGRKFLVPSTAYERFRNAALWELKKHKVTFLGAIKIDYTFSLKGKLDIDTDNAMASVNDVLEDAGIIENDKLIMKGSFEKITDQKDWKTVIKIEQI